MPWIRVRWARVALVAVALSTVACSGSLAQVERERDLARAERDALRAQLRCAQEREARAVHLLAQIHPRRAYIRDVEVTGNRVIPVLNPVIAWLNFTDEEHAELERLLEER